MTTTTVLPAGKARGVTKRNAPHTAKHIADTKRRKPAAKRGRAKATRAKAKPAARSSSRPAGTFTTVDLAAEHGISAKTLRARIRRNLDDWAPLFKDGQKHVFTNNKTTRNKCAALLA